MTYQVVSFCRREKNKGKKGKLKKREKKERGCLHVWKRVSSPLCASTRGRVPSSQYLCQVGLDSRPLPRPHWASVQSRDPISLLMIGCGLLPTLRQKETSSSFREKIQKKNGGSFFPTKIEVIRGHSRGWFDEANWDKNVPENSGRQLSKSIAE